MSLLRSVRSAASDEAGGEHLVLIRELLAERDAEATALVGDATDILENIGAGVQPKLVVLFAPDSTPDLDVSRVRAVLPYAQLLVLGVVNDVHMFRALLAAGASDYVTIPSDRDTLASAIDRLLGAAAAASAAAPAAAPSGLGSVVVVVGTRGGVGTTTTAITLAWLLGEEAGKRTALVDFDLQFGTVALSLDIDPGRGLRDALEQPERIDGLYIDRATVKIGANLYALSAEEAIEEPLSYDPAAAGVLIDELRRKFDWIVIDLPRGETGLAQAILALANYTMIIADSTLAGLRDTLRLNALAMASNPDQRVMVLKGGALGNRGGVSRAEFEKELGRPLDAAIPSDPKAAMEAANAGQPLPQAATNSPAVAAMRQIMSRLDGSTPKGRKLKLSQLLKLSTFFNRP